VRGWGAAPILLEPDLGGLSLSRKHPFTPLWLWVLVLIYAATFGALSILKHDTFHSYTLDLGIMSQVVWNTAHGRPFETSLDRPLNAELVGSYLGNHVRPVLLLLAPLYRLWPDPCLLLVLQSAALGLGAVPLFWIARRRLQNPRLQAGLVVGYLLYPALGFLNLFDFHAVALSIPFLLLAYWALEEEHRVVFWVMILLALVTKEEMVVPIAAFGLYCLARPQRRRTGLRLLLLATVWAFLCFAVIIPHYNEGRPYRFFSLWGHLLPRSSAGGESEAAGRSTVPGVLSADTFYFLVHLLLPLGFLPLLGPDLLAVSLPSLAYLLLSGRPELRRIGFQYPAVLIPWLFLAALQGLARLERRFGARRRRAWGGRFLLYLLLLGTVGGNLPYNAVLFHWRSGDFDPVAHREQLEAALVQIPPQAGVATNNYIGPHLAQRRRLIDLDLYPLPLRRDHLQSVDYVLLDLVDCRAVVAPDPRAAYAEMVRQVLDTRQFSVRTWSGRILLLQRGGPSDRELDEVWDYVEGLVGAGRGCWP